jgi:hypothetical protein
VQVGLRGRGGEGGGEEEGGGGGDRDDQVWMRGTASKQGEEHVPRGRPQLQPTHTCKHDQWMMSLHGKARRQGPLRRTSHPAQCPEDLLPLT